MKEYDKIEFYVDNKLMYTDDSEPFLGLWIGTLGFTHILKVISKV